MPELVSFPSGILTLRGFLHRPAHGAGPFPALTWNHGSEPDPGSADALGAFYGSNGFVLFVPHRRGHGESPGQHFAKELEAKARSESADPAEYRHKVVELVVELHELHLHDTVAAVDWLRQQPFVDPDRLAVSGVSYGGVQTVLAAEAGAAGRAFVPFAPAAMAWDTSPALRERLVRAVRAAEPPIFLLQAENDYSLGPSEVLGRELKQKGKRNRCRVYPPFGRTRQSGHGDFACRGMGVWGDDVRAFLDRAFSE